MSTAAEGPGVLRATMSQAQPARAKIPHGENIMTIEQWELVRAVKATKDLISVCSTLIKYIQR